MTKIEVADDSGNEISEFNVPIPFYIRVKLDEGMTRYRVKLIDDLGNIRGQYIGTTDRAYLELHVPLIKLPNLGKLRILVEESSGDSSYSQQHLVSLRYIEYISTKPEIIQEVNLIKKFEIEPKPLGKDSSNALRGREILKNIKTGSNRSKDNESDLLALSEEELSFLFKREDIKKENQKSNENNISIIELNNEISETFRTDSDEEE